VTKHQLIFRAFTSRPTSSLASIKVFVLCYLYYHPVDSHHQHKPAANVFHLISVPSGLPGPSYGMYYNKFESNGNKASPCFRPFWIGKLSDRYLPVLILLYDSFKHILFSLTSFMVTPNLSEYCTAISS
jgi:hypothetical protein